MTTSVAEPDSGGLFAACVRRIEASYEELGHTLGWRFLYTSRNVLKTRPRIAFVTINPGGSAESPDHPRASCEAGSAFIVECWNGAAPGSSVLQRQVRALFAALSHRLDARPSGDSLLERSLLASFIPFRSPTIAALPRKPESLAFGRSLWRDVLARTTPELIICLGRDVQRELRTLLDTGSTRHLQRSSYPTGWGDFHAEIDTFPDAERRVRLLYLPHLSRFGLFTRARCRGSMQRILDAVVE